VNGKMRVWRRLRFSRLGSVVWTSLTLPLYVSGLPVLLLIRVDSRHMTRLGIGRMPGSSLRVPAGYPYLKDLFAVWWTTMEKLLSEGLCAVIDRAYSAANIRTIRMIERLENQN
jgi:hypothetical protein